MTISPPTKRTPLYATVEQLQAEFIEQAGWQIANRFADPETELEAAQHRLALADCSAIGKIMVQGQGAESRLQSLWAVPLLNLGRGLALADKQVYRLRADRYLITTPPDRTEETVETLTAAAPNGAELLTVTDITHGRSELWLLGPAGRTLLNRLCGLDLQAAVFPNLTAKSSSVAKTTQLIIRHDLDNRHAWGDLLAYRLIGAASLGPYLWQTIMAAGADLGISPLGAAALDSLGWPAGGER